MQSALKSRHGVKKEPTSLYHYCPTSQTGAGILSEQMTTRYFDATMTVFLNHETVVMDCGMAAISPIGLIVFRGLFTRRAEAIAEAKAYGGVSRRPQMNKSR